AATLAAGLLVTQATTTVHGTVRSQPSGDPISQAFVTIHALDKQTMSDTAGEFTLLDVPAGRFELHVRALGYASRSILFESTTADDSVRVDVALDLEPIRLRPLTARAERVRQAGGAAERALFDREVSPGVVGMAGQELREVPALAEPDVLRSLAALPDVAPLNDISAQLHVQGGAPDQNLYRLDGARIFAPYHLFGLFGAFNADAVGRVDLYRGHLPARYGGALSAVIDVAPPAAVGDPIHVLGGVSLLGARATARGEAMDGDAQWLVAARRTHAELFAGILDDAFDEIPYAFGDIQVRGSLRRARDERMSASVFASRDRFDMFLDGADGSLDSRWRNAAGSLRWERSAGPGGRSARLWASHYAASMRTGTADASPTTRNDITVGGLAFDLTRPGGTTGYRIGMEVEGGAIDLAGPDEPGAYVMGDAGGAYLLASAWGEFERWLGPLRLAPGLRLGLETGAGRLFVEPRLSARYHLADGLALTAGLGRIHQFLSTLRDDRYPVPGAPMWVVHPETAPASRADGASLSLEGWRGEGWSVHATGYLRRFQDVARWRPVGTRTIDELAFDDGWARGASLLVRRHEGSVRGWVAYGRAQVRLTDSGTGQRYHAAWDRRETVDAALFLHAFEAMTVSARANFASGRPFWPQIGEVDGDSFSPVRGGIREDGESYPIFAAEQLRFPDHFRLDLSLRSRIKVGRLQLEPYVSMLNVTLRRNVLYYRLAPSGPQAERPVLEPEHILPAFPSIGLDARF
ncbi:MAG: TonB-dependent receptor, partial [Gemmatimonadota bacterium]